jgi:hypothetical protein
MFGMLMVGIHSNVIYMCSCSFPSGQRCPYGTVTTISAFMAQIPGVSDRMTLSPSLSLFLSFSPSFFFFLLLFSSYLSFSLIDVIMIMKMSALGGERERARGERKIRGEGGGAARNCFGNS